MERITEHSSLIVDIESFSSFKAEDGNVLRIVYFRSDDPRRMTSFIECDITSIETLYALLKQIAPDKGD